MNKSANNTQEINVATKAEQLIEVAKWVKRQNDDFTKNFKSMVSIIKFYSQLPECYDKKKSIVAFINKNLNADRKKWDSYTAHSEAERISVLVNTFFEFRYFKNAPYKWVLEFGLRHYPSRNGGCYEVFCSPYDRCNIFDRKFNPLRHATHSITIKTLGDAKRAAGNLLVSVTKNKGNDYKVTYSSNLMGAMEKNAPTEEDLQEGIEVEI